jgi:hypothetical protein
MNRKLLYDYPTNPLIPQIPVQTINNWIITLTFRSGYDKTRGMGFSPEKI